MTNKIDNAFKTAPTHEELCAMDRDLRFYPSTGSDPAAVSAEQVAAYNRNGYIKNLRIFDKVEITEHRAFFAIPQLLPNVPCRPLRIPY